MDVIYDGTSITASPLPDAYPILADRWIKAAHPEYDWSRVQAAHSGKNTWYLLCRMAAEVLPNPCNLMVFDFANDGGGDNKNDGCAEAFLRRFWTAYPSGKIIVMCFSAIANQAGADPTPTNQVAIDMWRALCAHYGVPTVDYYDEIERLVNDEGHLLSEYFADTIHPNSGGHALASSLLAVKLPSLLASGRQAPADLSTFPRLTAISADYENTPIIRTGVDNDGTTGTWSTSGTQISSSEVGATVSWTGTFQSIGCIRLDGQNNPNVELSIDGGAYAVFTFYPNGREIGARGLHTVTVKVASGTLVIDEFLAI